MKNDKRQNTMNNLVLTLLISLTSLTMPSGSIATFSQGIALNNNTTSLITNLDGPIEIEYWDNHNIMVETTIASSINSDYALNYALKKKHFKLEPIFSDHKDIVTLMPKRINTTLLISGQKQKTKHFYKIFLPKHVDHSYD